MKLKLLILILIAAAKICTGQTSLEALALENGKYTVGFKHYLQTDSSRTYKRAGDWSTGSLFREIPVSIWYPATKPAKAPLSVLDYMRILKEEEEWEHLPDEQILNWFYYPNTETNQAHLKEKANAYLNAREAEGKFPVLIYSPSFQASSIENFALCGFLASMGYVVIASPSRGADTRTMQGGSIKDVEAQARDIEFLIGKAGGMKNVKEDKIALMGFSFGGLSNVLTQMRNGNVKAVVSLDGSIKYQYPTLKLSPFYKIDNVNVPFINMSQKDIPDHVLAEDKIDASLNTNFDFYDNLRYSQAYSLKFKNLSHAYFSTLGVLFQDRDKRQDKSDPEIMESYKLVCEYSIQFLNAFIKEDPEAIKFMGNDPVANGLPAGLIERKAKTPERRQLSFEDFNMSARQNSFKDLDKLYQSFTGREPEFKLDQGKLNNLGLQLLFNPKTSDEGVKVLTFATELYPESANLFDSLAEAWLFTGDKKMAIQNFKKSLELDPQNQNAVERLKQLGSH